MFRNPAFHPVPRIKICGMRNMESVLMAVGYGADAVGFITEVPVRTHRRIDREEARELVAATPPFVTTVMVCMPEDLKNALELVDSVRPDAVQVHSSMALDDLKSLKKYAHVKIIKTININQATHVGQTLEYVSTLENIADAILLDSSAGGKTGGTGTVHDWTKSKEITAGSPLPVILAGGLDPGNVSEGIRTVRPYGVDTVSGVETEMKLNEDKINMFIRNARGSGDERYTA